MLIFNPISGFFIVISIIKGGWYLLLIPCLITFIVFNLKLYFKYHNEQVDRDEKIDEILKKD